MDQQFTAEQWKRAEVAMIEAISDANGSARVVIEMLRIWDKYSSTDFPKPMDSEH